MCYNTAWVKCFLSTNIEKCTNCTFCNNKQYIRCYICNLGKYLNTLDNKPYNSLLYEMFYYNKLIDVDKDLINYNLYFNK